VLPALKSCSKGDFTGKLAAIIFTPYNFSVFHQISIKIAFFGLGAKQFLNFFTEQIMLIFSHIKPCKRKVCFSPMTVKIHQHPPKGRHTHSTNLKALQLENNIFLSSSKHPFCFVENLAKKSFSVMAKKMLQ
jgi:hypothetical protein